MPSNLRVPNLLTPRSLCTSIYASPTFKFIVDGTTYFIHSDLAAEHSPVLGCMMNGYMAEAQNQCATLESVDASTMERFIEWAYKGYYTPPEFTLDPNVTVPPGGKKGSKKPNDGPPVVNDSEEGPGEVRSGSAAENAPLGQAPQVQDENRKNGDACKDGEATVKKNKKPMTRKDLGETYVLHEYKTHPEGAVIESFRIRPNQANEDYTEVLLCHARLYVFAEMYDIAALKLRAFECLHYQLSLFNLSRERTGDIIALLRYVYANVKDGDGLRMALQKYVGFEMSALMKDERFGWLMIEDGGALLFDYMKMVAMRIH